MTPQQYERLTELFHVALAMVPDERESYLESLSGGDLVLRRELESLLAAHGRGDLTVNPPEDIAAGLYQAEQDGSAVDANALAPHTRLDRYEIRWLLGKGGMGEVYLAEDVRLHRLVALKILPSAFASSDDRIRRFEQEAQAAAALNHPSIAHIYEIGAVSDVNFIAMEFVDGVTLRSKIHREHTELRKLLKYLQQVAEGLAKAHAAGIVHRDLKPDNIMITRDDYAKILDFGIAKLIEPEGRLNLVGDETAELQMAASEHHSMAGMVMGTAGYMSPEQAQGRVEQIDQRSDVFSFGCILFEAVTGQKLFEGESALNSSSKVAIDATPSINDLARYVPPDLESVIRRCLAEDREERYQSIKDVALKLKEVRQGMGEAAGHMTDPPRSGGVDTSRRSGIRRYINQTPSIASFVSVIARKKTLVAIVFGALVAAVGYGLYKLTRPVGPASIPRQVKIARLTSTGRVIDGMIIPDGRQIVFAVEDAGRQSIWIKGIGTKIKVQIVPPSKTVYEDLRWSHDGQFLYFNKRERNGTNSIFRMALPPDGVPHKIIENVTSRPELSADDKQIAFIRGTRADDETSLWVANSDGSREHVLATHMGHDSFFSGGIAWTPNGESIVCATGLHAENVIEVSFHDEKRVNTPKWFAFNDIKWLPDGSGMVVIAQERIRTPSQIWLLPYPNGEPFRITNDLSNYVNLSLTADSRTVVAMRQETISHIWLAPDGDASRAVQLTTGTGQQDGNPAVNWTPDGRIVYDSTASETRQTWIMNADGSDQRQLSNGDFEQQGAHVSPDGRYIVFSANRGVTQNIYRMDLDGNNVKQLTFGKGEAAPFFSRDGRWVICSWPAPYASWKVPSEGGELVQLTNDSWASSISPDGKLMAYVRPEGAGSHFWKIMVMPFEGKVPLKTIDVISESRPNSRWTADGRAITYNVTRGGVLAGVTNLWSQSLYGGQPKQLTTFNSDTFVSFDWSRDGKQLVYGRGATNYDLVLFTGFR